MVAALVIAGAWFSVRVNVWELGPTLLVAVISSVYVPPLAAPLVVAAGVPEITPVEALSIKPEGNVPLLMA